MIHLNLECLWRFSLNAMNQPLLLKVLRNEYHIQTHFVRYTKEDPNTKSLMEMLI